MTANLCEPLTVCDREPPDSRRLALACYYCTIATAQSLLLKAVIVKSASQHPPRLVHAHVLDLTSAIWTRLPHPTMS